MKKMKYVIFSLALVATLLLGIIIGRAQLLGSTFYVRQGIYPGAPSYTIWKDDSTSTYYAKNANGQIAYADTTAETVINSAISTGTSIYFSAGEYDLTDSITVDSNTYLSSNQAILDGSALGASTPIIEVLFVDNITVTGFHIKEAAHCGVYINASDYVTIENNFFDGNGWGISTNCLSGYTMMDLKILDNTVMNSYYHGVQITGKQAAPSGNMSVLVSNNFIANTGLTGGFAFSTGIDIENWGSPSGNCRANVQNNIIKRNWEDGIHVEKVNGTVLADGNTCTENGVNPVPTYGTGILMADVAEGVVSNNILRENGKYGLQVYQSQTYFHSINIVGNSITTNVDRGIFVSIVNVPTPVFPSVLVQGNYVSDNGQDGFDLYVPAGLGNITYMFTVRGNTFANNLRDITGDVYQAEIKFYASGAGTTYIVAFCMDNIIVDNNDHTYPIIVCRASLYVIQGITCPLIQRGVNIANSNGISQYNYGF